MYFLLAGVIDRFRFLRYGLAFILSFVGVKMLISEQVHIPTVFSLLVVAGGLAVSVALSMLMPLPEPDEEDGPNEKPSDAVRHG
jgi:tellurite resistance protein TerC